MTHAWLKPLVAFLMQLPAVRRKWLVRPRAHIIAAVMVGCLPAVAVAQTCSGGINMRDLKVSADARSSTTPKTETSLHPAITRLATSFVKSFACQGFVNFYAARVGLPDDIVRDGAPHDQLRDNAYVMHFTNTTHGKLNKDVCGSIRFGVPLGLPGHDAKTNFESWLNRATRMVRSNGATTAENDAYKAINKLTATTIIRRSSDFYNQSDNLISRFLPYGNELPQPSVQNLLRIIRSAQDEIAGHFASVVQERKWDEVAIARFVDLAKCAALPIPTEPDEDILANYRSAFADYKRFTAFLDKAMPP